jgi:phosphatidylserine/phosphatidylglycerophosphate/cardiolipin synthase-like enzyme
MTQALDLALGRDFPHKIIPLIKEAKRNIDIIAYEWRWYPDQSGSINTKFNQAIINSARAGVQVRALLNSVHIVNTLNTMGILAKKIPSGKTLHTKLMLIDNRYSIMGSHNYTTSAFLVNFEASIIIDDIHTACKFQEYFDSLYKN